jgi:DeoR/GlpR family transcriptional regulator of sugar metabolism
MLAIERRKKIMSILQEKNSVLVPELSKTFEVTEETIRRDLEKLEKEGLLKRTYGGAVINESTNADLPLNIREVTNIEGKESIAAKLVEYIEDGDTIILDSSSTALQVAKLLKNKKKITVITNSVKVVLELAASKDCNVISTGGTLREMSMSFVGSLAENSIKNYNVDKAIISCKGLDKAKGITESNEAEAQVKKAMISVADKVFLAVDNRKFDKVAFVKLMNINDIHTMFTDEKLSEEWEQFVETHGSQIVYGN